MAKDQNTDKNSTFKALDLNYRLSWAHQTGKQWSQLGYMKPALQDYGRLIQSTISMLQSIVQSPAKYSAWKKYTSDTLPLPDVGNQSPQKQQNVMT